MAKDFDPNIGKSTQFRTGDEQAKIAQKGGKASGEARRERKDYKERMKTVLAVAVPSDSPVMDRAKKFGLNEDELKNHTYEDAAIVSVVQRLIKEGRVRDLMDLYKLLGEYVDVQKIEGLPKDKSDLLLVPKKEG